MRRPCFALPVALAHHVKALTSAIPPILCRYNELMSDPAYVDGVLADGAATANETANRTLDACKDAMGFVLPVKR